jgi:hypothetical protein
MKKAAILIFGVYREFAEVRDKWCDIEQLYDCDYYMSTWDVSSQKYEDSKEYKTFYVTSDMITDYLPNCVFEILNQKEIFPIPAKNNANYLFYHWQNVYRLMEESNKKYDIVFLVRADADLVINKSDEYVRGWCSNHIDELYSSSHMLVYELNPLILFATDTFLFGSPNVMGKVIKTLPDMMDITLDIGISSHIYLANHMIKIGIRPTANHPFSSNFHRPFKSNKIEKIVVDSIKKNTKKLI